MVYLPDDLLAKVDRASMHFSLEARVPFLDPRVVSFAWSLPLHSKIDHDERKVLLRRVLYRYLPAALVDRRKMGFAVPLAEWLRVGLRDWAEELLDERRLRQDGFFHPGLVRREWEAWLQSDTPGRSLRFWSILMFQAWLDHNRKQPPAADSGAVRRSTGLPASVH
jgi:asparagine synthase (glutamine-hydrolysing)